MRAVRFDAYGDPGVLRQVEVAAPTPGPGEVLIEVEHAGVNFAEVMFRRGQFQIGVPHVPGLEAAGTVAEVGEGVTQMRQGQRVAALTLAGGGYAEYVVARADLTVLLDGPLAGMSSVLAAAFPCNVPVAWGVLNEVARLRGGETVLVLAAAGGVGTAAVQLARQLGAGAVYGVTSSEEKATYAAGFGFDQVLTYDGLSDRVGELTGGRGVDVILDSVGGEIRKSALDMLSPFGRHIVFGDAADSGDVEFSGNGMWGTSRLVGGYNLGGIANERPELLGDHLAMAARSVAEGTVRIEVTEFPLADAAKAHELLESRASTGKYVLSVKV